jgi:hypothetical protein
MPVTKNSERQRDHRDAPTYWFAVLEIARERGDFEWAAEAQRQLERLGVIVRFDRQRKGAEDER